jgi:hypothetical protein
MAQHFVKGRDNSAVMFSIETFEVSFHIWASFIKQGVKSCVLQIMRIPLLLISSQFS